MSIAYPLSLPATKAAAEIRLRMCSTVGNSGSPFTPSDQSYTWTREWWEADVTLPPMKRADASEWIGLIASMNGMQGSLYMGDPLGATPRGIATGTPLVKGASQTGKTLETDGWTISQNGILKRMDWIQLSSGTSSRLHAVVVEPNSDSSGNATLEIWPALRESPADNSAIVVSGAKGRWRLRSNSNEWAENIGGIYSVTFTLVEDLRALA